MEHMIFAVLIIALVGPIALEPVIREILCRIYAWRYMAWKRYSREDAILAMRQYRLRWKRTHKCL